MLDKTLSTPWRTEGPFHACPGAGRATRSWWPAGRGPSSLMSSALSAVFELAVVERHKGTKPVGHMSASPVLALTRAVLDGLDAEAEVKMRDSAPVRQQYQSVINSPTLLVNK